MQSTSYHTINPRSYDIFAGLDVDSKSVASTFLDSEQMIKSIQFPYQPQALIQYVRNHFSDKRVVFAYEAGPTGLGLYDELIRQGYPCLVVPSAFIPRVPGSQVKTNRLDSVKLAGCLRGGQLKSIHIPPPCYRELRHLVQLRDASLSQVQTAKRRVKSLLLLESVPFPENSGWWTERLTQQLKELSLNPSVHFKLLSLLAALEFSKKQMLQTQKEIRRLCQRETELEANIRLLTTIPGVGSIVAAHLLARIGDWRQIPKSKHVASFLGLTPREHSTGDSVRKGRITGSGDPRLRSKLIQGAWMAVRHDRELGEFYHRIYRNHPQGQAAQKAIVAVARKLAMRVGSVLKNQKPFESRFTPSQTVGERCAPGTSSDNSQN